LHPARIGNHSRICCHKPAAAAAIFAAATKSLMIVLGLWKSAVVLSMFHE
jgi:hypothetical protein